MNEQQAKALFFAQYLGQKVFTHKDLECFNDKSLSEIDATYLQSGSNRLSSGYLLLRSVSQLTDEEIITIATIIFGDKINDIQKLLTRDGVENIFTSGCNTSGQKMLKIFDYLLRIGILIPFTYLDETNKPVTFQPDEIIALGWAKIKE